MGVTKRTIQWLLCDHCVTQGPETIEGAKHARELAKREGWGRFNGVDTCPRCLERFDALRAKEAV